jgi:hypothetical protein
VELSVYEGDSSYRLLQIRRDPDIYSSSYLMLLLVKETVDVDLNNVNPPLDVEVAVPGMGQSDSDH